MKARLATLPAGRDVPHPLSSHRIVLLSPVVLCPTGISEIKINLYPINLFTWNPLYSIQLIQETNQSETESKKHTNTTTCKYFENKYP